jgi:hypothetical protein
MRRFSRWMPALAEPAGTAGERIIIWCLVVPLVVLLLPFLLLNALLGKFFAEEDYFLRLAAERKGEDIGTFAQAFDRHAEPFDPWVIRATWDALRSELGGLPLRPSDNLTEDFGLDEEIDSIIPKIAVRSGRSLEFVVANPFNGKIKTVGDLVRFITRQPAIAGGLE